MFEGFRVQHNIARGPAKGGIRFHPTSRSRRSRRWPSWNDLEVRGRRHPFGGGKGGIKGRSAARCRAPSSKRLTRRYAADLSDLFGPESDVPAPDVKHRRARDGVDRDTYSMHERRTELAVVTGSRSRSGAPPAARRPPASG